MILFFVTARYRLPAVPILLLFAAFGLYRLWHTSHLPWVLVGVVGVTVLTNLGAGRMDMAGDTQQRFWMGYAYEKKGMVANAMREYHAVIEDRPDHQNALLSLANLYNAKAQHADAIELYHQYLRFYPQTVPTRFLLGNTYLGTPVVSGGHRRLLRFGSAATPMGRPPRPLGLRLSNGWPAPARRPSLSPNP